MPSQALAHTATATRPEPQREAPVAASKPFVVGSLSEIKAGNVLLRDNESIPGWLKCEMRRIGRWNLLVGLDGNAVERSARKKSWHFSFIVPGIEAAAWGWNRSEALGKALREALRNAADDVFNGLEIIEVDVRRYLGLVRARVRANSRHLQPDPYLTELDPLYWDRGVWDLRRLAEAQGKFARWHRRVQLKQS